MGHVSAKEGSPRTWALVMRQTQRLAGGKGWRGLLPQEGTGGVSSRKE